MTFDDVHDFVAQNHNGTMVTFRRNGAAHASLITCGLYRDGVAFTTRGDAVKLANLQRDPRCTLAVASQDWWSYVVLEGTAEMISAENTSADQLRTALREAYVACAGKEHPSWAEYDQAMVEQGRPVIVVRPERVYGTLR